MPNIKFSNINAVSHIRLIELL